jgi:sugar lactone lactonase YvrE
MRVRPFASARTATAACAVAATLGCSRIYAVDGYDRGDPAPAPSPTPGPTSSAGCVPDCGDRFPNAGYVGAWSCVDGSCRIGSCKPGYLDCDGAVASGCEVDGRTSAASCGACLHDCLGGACEGGECRPLVVATDEASPHGIVSHAGYVYWTNGGTSAQGPSYTGTVNRLPWNGGQRETLASSLGVAFGIAVNDRAVYWTCFKTEQVMSKTFVENSTPQQLAASEASPVGLAVSRAGVFWATFTDPGRVRRLASLEAPGPPETVAEAQSSPLGVAADDTHVYWTNFGPYGQALGSVMRSSAVPPYAPQVLAKDVANPSGITVDATHVYWVTKALHGEVVRWAVGGLTAPATLVADQPYPISVAVDDRNVYWATFGANGSVLRAPRAGGAVTTLATGQPYPTAVALSPTAAYWIVTGNEGSANPQPAGKVMRLAK